MSTKRRDFLDHEQELAVVRAIREAERGGQGEVRVHVEARCASPSDRAGRLFRTLGLESTKDGTGALLYLAVESGAAAVQLGRGLSAHESDPRWRAAADAAERGARRGDPGAGLVEGLSVIGELFRELVPGPDLEGSELPDRVSGPEDDPDRAGGESVSTQEVGELIEIADGLRMEREDELSLDELRRIAAELGIDDPDLEEARAELERRRERRRVEAEARRRLLRRLALGAAVFAALCLLALAWGHRSLRKELAEVEHRRTQVESVRERQAEVLARYGSLADDPEKRAVLSGAANRVAVERRRLDEAVARYNARAGSFPGLIWAALTSLPGRVPVSDGSPPS